MTLSAKQNQFYQKLKFLSSIHSSKPLNYNIFNNDDLFEICQYAQPIMIMNNKQKNTFNLIKRLSQYHDVRNGDSCLHIAAKASNTKLVQYLIESKIINANTKNNRNQNPLTSLLINNSDNKSQKIGYILAKYTDITSRDIQQNRAFQVNQAKMDASRARLLQFLRKKAAGK